VSNPVAFFAQDNNGTIIQLPAVPSGGETSVSWRAGFRHRDASQQRARQRHRADGSDGIEAGAGSSNPGSFTTQFGGQAFPDSFIDSGSNGLYFLDSSTLAAPGLGGNALPPCPQSGAFSNDSSIGSFYCGTLSSSATNVGSNGASTVVHIGVANAETLFMSEQRSLRHGCRTQLRQLRLGNAFLLWAECLHRNRGGNSAERRSRGPICGLLRARLARPNPTTGLAAAQLFCRLMPMRGTRLGADLRPSTMGSYTRTKRSTTHSKQLIRSYRRSAASSTAAPMLYTSWTHRLQG
jgi:hypothetical protein